MIPFTLNSQNQDHPRIFLNCVYRLGGLERVDTTQKVIYLTFTGGDYNDGSKTVLKTLKGEKVIANFFLTGDFLRNKKNKKFVKRLVSYGHYLGPHSDKHLLYASWTNRDSLLVSKDSFNIDLSNNYNMLEKFGVHKKDALFFMPPFEWYNQQISNWTADFGSILVNYSPGTRSNADYTTPDMGDRYLSSEQIIKSILNYESSSTSGMNGFILLLHIGTHPDRTDKLYNRLDELIQILRERGYQFRLLAEVLN